MRLAYGLRCELYGTTSQTSSPPHDSSSGMRLRALARQQFGASGVPITMILYGADGDRLGMLERFEIDSSGQITGLVARGYDLIARRVASPHVRELRLGAIAVELTAAEFEELPEVIAQLLPLMPLMPPEHARMSA